MSEVRRIAQLYLDGCITAEELITELVRMLPGVENADCVELASLLTQEWRIP